MLKEAKESAMLGEISWSLGIEGEMKSGMEEEINSAEYYAKKIGKDISSQVAEIEKIGYEKDIPEDLAAAKKYAESSSIVNMESHIEFARKYARKVGKDISQEVEKIESVGYKNIIPVELSEAEKNARSGDAKLMESYIESVKEHADKAGKDISQEVEKIEKIGYTNAIPVELAEAEKCAKSGKERNMNAYARRAKEYADKIEQDISQKIEKIEKIYNEFKKNSK